MTIHPLDHAVWASLTGPHAHLARGSSEALGYPAEVSPFVALRPDRIDDGIDRAGWDVLGQLVGPGQIVGLFAPVPPANSLPPGWEVVMHGEALQLLAGEQEAPSLTDPEVVTLGEDDVEEMLDLVARTQPGPFAPRTHTLGGYLGIRRNGALVAMAGQRLNPPGWREISAVCTDPAFRGQGLAAKLIKAVADDIRLSGLRPFLHTAADNAGAIRLYDFLGFTVRRKLGFVGVRTPQ